MKSQLSPPFDVKSMSHKIQFQTETLNTIYKGNSSHFMQTISSYLVNISVNVVNYYTIITWCKIVIDNFFVMDKVPREITQREYMTELIALHSARRLMLVET